MPNRQLLSTLFCCTVSLSASLLYCALRVGFDTPVLPVLRTAVLALFLHCLPLMAERLPQRRSGAAPRWYDSNGFFLLAGMLSAAALGFGFGSLSFPLFGAAALFGMYCLAADLRAVRGLWVAGFCCGSALFGIWISAALWTHGYQHPLFRELISYGVVYSDTIYHSAISNMISTYSVPAMGLDGIHYLHYHWGSHLLFAGLAKLLGIEPIQFYQLGLPVIIIPFFLSSLCAFAFAAAPQSLSRAAARKEAVVFWLLFGATFLNVLPPSALDNMTIGNSYLISESYNVGLSLALLCMAIGSTYLTGRHTAKNRHSDHVYLLAVLPLCLGLVGTAKVSLMLILGVAGLYLFFRLHGYRSLRSCVSLFICAATIAFVYSNVRVTWEGATYLEAFSYLRNFVPAPWQPAWFVFAFMWSWIFIAARARSKVNLGAAIGARRLLDVEILLVVVFASMIPPLLVYIRSASGLYFWDFQRWVAAGFLLGNVAVLADVAERFFARISSSKVGRFAAVLAATIFIASAAMNFTSPFRRMFADRAYMNDLTKDYASRESTKVVRALELLSRMSTAEKRETLLYIPRSNVQYWKLHDDCMAIPLIAPAITGIAALDGLPAESCVDRGFGFADHRAATPSVVPASPTTEQLCEAAKKRGFAKVLVFDWSGQGEKMSALSCSSGIGAS